MISAYKKIILVVIIFVLGVCAFPAFSDELKLDYALKKVVFKSKGDNNVTVKLITNKKLQSKPILFEKTKNTFFIALSATQYIGEKNPDISDVSSYIKSANIDFVPYKSNVRSGYTRVVIHTNEGVKLNLEVSQSDNSAGIIVLAIAGGIITLVVIGYLGFALYLKLRQRKKTDSELILDDYNNDLQRVLNSEIPSTNLEDSQPKEDIIQPDIIQNADLEETIPPTETLSDNFGEKELNDDNIETTENIEPTPDEIVMDILKNDTAIEEISDSISDENEAILDFLNENNVNKKRDEVSSDFDSISSNGENEALEFENPLLNQDYSDNDNTVANEESFVVEEKSDDKKEDATTTDNDYAIATVNHLSGGSAMISSKVLDFTKPTAKEEPEKKDEFEEDDLSVFDELGLSGVIGDADFELYDKNSSDTDNNKVSEELEFEDTEIDDIFPDETQNTVEPTQSVPPENLLYQEEQTEKAEEEQVAQDVQEPNETVSLEELYQEEQTEKAEEEQVAQDVQEPNETVSLEELCQEEQTTEKQEEQVAQDVQEPEKTVSLEELYQEEQTEKAEEEQVAQDVQEPDENEEKLENILFSEEEIIQPEEDNKNEDISFTPRTINTQSFFSDDVDVDNYKEEFFTEDTDENTISETDFEDGNSFVVSNTEEQKSDIQENNITDDENYLDDSEPIVLDEKNLSSSKSLYLIRHNGEYSLIASDNDKVFVIEKFAQKPLKTEISVKLNEKKQNADIYLTKVGKWRALLSVDEDSVKNVLTL